MPESESAYRDRRPSPWPGRLAAARQKLVDHLATTPTILAPYILAFISGWLYFVVAPAGERYSWWLAIGLGTLALAAAMGARAQAARLEEAEKWRTALQGLLRRNSDPL
jgi:hypothetical protein